MTLKMLGHLWYADRSIGEFVRQAERTFELPLFAFTGDHYGRKFINTHPGSFERSAVPFILYGKDVLGNVERPKEAAGSHIDIAPTLIEMTAPRGFSYYALGSNILGRKRPPLGIGRDWVIGPGFLADVNAASRASTRFRAMNCRSSCLTWPACDRSTAACMASAGGGSRKARYWRFPAQTPCEVLPRYLFPRRVRKRHQRKKGSLLAPLCAADGYSFPFGQDPQVYATSLPAAARSPL